LLDRPILRRDGRRIGADDLGQRVAPGAQQRRSQIVLDIFDQAEALVGQRRIKLDQAGAGADLGQRGAPLSMPRPRSAEKAPSVRT